MQNKQNNSANQHLASDYYRITFFVWGEVAIVLRYPVSIRKFLLFAPNIQK